MIINHCHHQNLHHPRKEGPSSQVFAAAASEWLLLTAAKCQVDRSYHWHRQQHHHHHYHLHRHLHRRPHHLHHHHHHRQHYHVNLNLCLHLHHLLHHYHCAIKIFIIKCHGHPRDKDWIALIYKVQRRHCFILFKPSKLVLG